MLWEAVKVTASGVVHGNGVVARRELASDTELIDPSAIFVPGKPSVEEQGGQERNHYIASGTCGYFKVHPSSDRVTLVRAVSTGSEICTA